MLRVLFISDNFPPEVNAPATRTWEHCKTWVQMGAKVTVITCAPNFPQGVVYSGYRNRLYGREFKDGIEIIRVWSYISRNEGVAKRIIDHLSFAFSAFLAGSFKRSDVIIATSPQFFTTFSAYGLSVLKRRPWVFEVRDIWPESVSAVGAMKQSKLLRLAEKIELFMYRKCDLIVPVTAAFKRNLAARGVPSDKMHVVTNGVAMDQFRPMEKDADLLKQLNLGGKFVIGYIGTHGMAHGLEFIVDSLAHLDDPNIHFLFVGDGAKKAAVMERARQHRLTNATFIDPIPKHEVRRYLSLLDAALVPLKRSDTFKSVIPSKIFECAAMEKPILLGVDGEARSIVEKHGAGLFFVPEDRDSFVCATRRLSSDEALLGELKAGCRSLALAYDRERLARDMLTQLQGLGACPPLFKADA